MFAHSSTWVQGMSCATCLDNINIFSTLASPHKISAELSVKVLSHPRQSFQKWIKLAEWLTKYQQNWPHFKIQSHFVHYREKIHGKSLARSFLWYFSFYSVSLSHGNSPYKKLEMTLFKKEFKVFMFHILW